MKKWQIPEEGWKRNIFLGAAYFFGGWLITFFCCYVLVALNYDQVFSGEILSQSLMLSCAWPVFFLLHIVVIPLFAVPVLMAGEGAGIGLCLLIALAIVGYIGYGVVIFADAVFNEAFRFSRVIPFTIAPEIRDNVCCGPFAQLLFVFLLPLFNGENYFWIGVCYLIAPIATAIYVICKGDEDKK